MKWLWLVPMVAVVVFVWRHAGRDGGKNGWRE